MDARCLTVGDRESLTEGEGVHKGARRKRSCPHRANCISCWLCEPRVLMMKAAVSHSPPIMTTQQNRFLKTMASTR